MDEGSTQHIGSEKLVLVELHLFKNTVMTARAHVVFKMFSSLTSANKRILTKQSPKALFRSTAFLVQLT